MGRLPDSHLAFVGDALQKQINIVLLHTLWADSGSGAPLEPMRESVFRKLVRDLAYEGYHFLSSEEVYQYYMGHYNIPAKNVWLTFDDGWECTHTYGTPILQEFGARASMSPEYNKLGDSGRLSLAQLEELYNTGVWDIDTHGWYGHGGSFPPGYNASDYEGSTWYYRDRLYITSEQRYMTDEEHKDLMRADFQACKDIIEPITGRPVRGFMYPAGEIGFTGNDPTRIPYLNFEVMDEFGIIGFRVSDGQAVTPYSDRHYGRRAAWDKASGIMDIYRSGINLVEIFTGFTQYGNKFLGGRNEKLQWFNSDFSPDGDEFGLLGYDMGGWIKPVYDPYADKFWAAANATLYDFDPVTKNILRPPVDPWVGEITGIFVDENYIYAVARSNGVVRRAPKSSLSFSDYGQIPGHGSWQLGYFVAFIENRVYVLSSIYNCLCGYDVYNGFELVHKIHLPHNHPVLPHTGICINNDITKWGLYYLASRYFTVYEIG